MGLKGFALTAALLAVQAGLLDYYYKNKLSQEPGKRGGGWREQQERSLFGSRSLASSLVFRGTPPPL